MNIPPKAYEAAVRALFEDGCGEPKVDAATVLEAAAPFIRADTLHEHAKTWGDTRDEYNRSIAQHVHMDARKCTADELDPQ